MVVLPPDPGAAADALRGEELEQGVGTRPLRVGRTPDGDTRPRLRLDGVARCVVGQERGGNGGERVAVEEGAQLTGGGDLADDRVLEFPFPEYGLGLGEPVCGGGSNNSLLAFSNHDLPGY